ncbi:MAG: hypothetical protein P4M09_26305 [Devosia sp.]|nr:hypothetical protein [Devosia sp.]
MAGYLIKLWVGMLLASTAAVMVAAVPARAADVCLDTVAAQALVTSGQIKKWPEIRAMAGISSQYKQLKLKVCDHGGQHYYVVNVLGPSGDSRTLFVNAVDGSQLAN